MVAAAVGVDEELADLVVEDEDVRVVVADLEQVLMELVLGFSCDGDTRG